MKSEPHDDSSRSRLVVVLVGPTASGKTPTSLRLARHLPIEIISADSRQIYKYMDIGTAKPSLEERRLVPHHFVDELEPQTEFNAGEFGIRGRQVIEEIFSRGSIPVVVGGAGLYVRALVDGLFEGPPASPELRALLFGRIANEGGDILLEELRSIDPIAASKMLPTNSLRIVRALEVYQLTGVPISEQQESQRSLTFTPLFFGLQWERVVLYDRINRRVDAMISAGLVGEVEALRDRGFTPEQYALRTPGYAEVFAYLQGEISSQEMIRLIKQNTRRYAKRQLTWFKYEERIRWFGLQCGEDFSPIADRIASYFQNGGVVA